MIMMLRSNRNVASSDWQKNSQPSHDLLLRVRPGWRLISWPPDLHVGSARSVEPLSLRLSAEFARVPSRAAGGAMWPKRKSIGQSSSLKDDAAPGFVMLPGQDVGCLVPAVLDRHD